MEREREECSLLSWTDKQNSNWQDERFRPELGQYRPHWQKASAFFKEQETFAAPLEAAEPLSFQVLVSEPSYSYWFDLLSVILDSVFVRLERDTLGVL